jgi:hypothetical protein
MLETPRPLDRRPSAFALRRARLLPLFAIGAMLSTSCGREIDYKQALQVTDLTGGWYDAGIVDGKNKLVPSMSFRIRKPADVNVNTISLNIIFKRISPDKKTEEDLDEVFLQKVEFSEGTQTPLLTVRPQHGYTGDAPQTRAQILEHSQFWDGRAVVFAKQSSTTWVDLIRYDIPRVLITK